MEAIDDIELSFVIKADVDGVVLIVGTELVQLILVTDMLLRPGVFVIPPPPPEVDMVN